MNDYAASPSVLPLRSELKRLTRERLIEVAMRLFEADGFRGTSVAKIVQEAGTTAPTFYRYFKSKSELMWIVQELLASKVAESMMSLDRIKRVTKPALREWVRSYAEVWHRLHGLCDAYWEATHTDTELAKGLVPATMAVVGSMKNLLGLESSSRCRTRLQMRLAWISLIMDRVMYVAECSRGTPLGEALLDEFTEMLWVLLSDRSR